MAINGNCFYQIDFQNGINGNQNVQSVERKEIKMCYTGKCRYENYRGECSLIWNMRVKKPLPPDAICVESEVEIGSSIDDGNLLHLIELNEEIKKLGKDGKDS